jgi:hypothetical protein
VRADSAGEEELNGDARRSTAFDLERRDLSWCVAASFETGEKLGRRGVSGAEDKGVEDHEESAEGGGEDDAEGEALMWRPDSHGGTVGDAANRPLTAA